MVDALSRSFEESEEEILFSSSSKGAPGLLLALSMPIYTLIDELNKESQSQDSIKAMMQKILRFKLEFQWIHG